MTLVTGRTMGITDVADYSNRNSIDISQIKEAVDYIKSTSSGHSSYTTIVNPLLWRYWRYVGFLRKRNLRARLTGEYSLFKIRHMKKKLITTLALMMVLTLFSGAVQAGDNCTQYAATSDDGLYCQATERPGSEGRKMTLCAQIVSDLRYRCMTEVSGKNWCGMIRDRTEYNACQRGFRGR